MVWKPLIWISHDIYEVQRLLNDSINAKLEIVSPYANPLCIVAFHGVKFKSPSFEMFICFDLFFFLSHVNVVRIIKLSPFKIIIIKNTCTKHFNP